MRSHERRLAALERARNDRPASGMITMKYGGVSGLLRQAREERRIDRWGKPLHPCTVDLDAPPPEGIAGLLWDAKRRRAEREAAQVPPSAADGT